MKGLLISRPLVKRSFLQRLFWQQPTENALFELNNLLATRPLLSVTKAEVLQIETAYGVELETTFPLNLEEMYASFWNRAIQAENTSDAQGALAHLQDLLNISDEAAAALREKIGSEYYAELASRILRKRRLLESDINELAQLTKKLALPSDTASRLLLVSEQKVMDKYLAPLREKRRCSPEQKSEVEEMMRSFAWSSAEIKKTLGELSPWVHLWELEHLSLQTVDAGIGDLQKSEICYFRSANVEWLETRSSRNMGTFLERIQTGTLYLTNKRLVMQGNLKTSALSYDRIRSVSHHGEGIQINKDKGKNPVLVIPGGWEAFEIVLKRLT